MANDGAGKEVAAVQAVPDDGGAQGNNRDASNDGCLTKFVILIAKQPVVIITVAMGL
eukprot:COSAG05_NODE_12697_length_458_cov_0.777159_1_plen_56_part_10